MAPVGLEARYRRLLRWYPPEHRAVHRDEMLGVLMSGAPQDRSRPGLAESADLLLGAVRIRVRPGRALWDRDGWRDALAVFSVAAPVLAFSSALLAWALVDLWLMLSGQQGGLGMGTQYFQGGLQPYSAIFYNVADAHPAIGPIIWLALYGQGLVAVLALLGLRRWAALASASYLIYAAFFAIDEVHYGAGSFVLLGLLQLPFLLIMPIMEIVALLASDGPRRGRSLLRRSHWAVLAAAGLAVATLRVPNLLASITGSTQPAVTSATLQTAGIIVLAALLAASWLSSGAGKRLAALFALLACPTLVVLTHGGGYPAWFQPGFLGGAIEIFAVLLLIAFAGRAIRRSRSQHRGDGAGTA
jgi:hypothetical protein